MIEGPKLLIRGVRGGPVYHYLLFTLLTTEYEVILEVWRAAILCKNSPTVNLSFYKLARVQSVLFINCLFCKSRSSLVRFLKIYAMSFRRQKENLVI